jgi:hypothetical protein
VIKIPSLLYFVSVPLFVPLHLCSYAHFLSYNVLRNVAPLVKDARNSYGNCLESLILTNIPKMGITEENRTFI